MHSYQLTLINIMSYEFMTNFGIIIIFFFINILNLNKYYNGIRRDNA